MTISTNAPNNRNVSPLKGYLRDMQNHRLLSREEERQLSRQYQKTNDQQALERLITGNLRLVVKIAKDFSKQGEMPLLDLIQEGNVGLIHAARKFDPAKETKFSYYAAFWIKAYIHKYMMDNYRTVRIGTTQSQRKLFFNLRKTQNRLAQMGVEPTAAAVAGELKVKREEVLEMQMRLNQPDLSLNAPLNADDQGEHLDRMRSKAPSAAQKFEKRQFQALVRENTSRFKSTHLDDREKAILERRILSNEPETLNKLGLRFGVSRERIRQVEKRIIEKLKTYLFTHIPDIQQFAFQ